MSFENYSALQAEIQSFLWDRADVVAKIPTFITLAEAEAKRLLRTQQAVLARPFTISGSIGAIPSGERAILSLTINLPQGSGTYDLDYATPEQLAEWSIVSPGQPRFYTIEGDRLRVLPVPDQSYTGTMRYRGVFDSLGEGVLTNWLLERHPDIYLAGALKYAKLWLIDQDADWSGMFYNAIAQANKDTPMRQTNTKLRADAITSMSGVGRYDVRSDTYGGRN